METFIIIAFVVSQFFSFDIQDEGEPIAKNVKIEFRLAESKKTDGFEEIDFDNKKIYLNPKIEITEKDISSVRKDYEPHTPSYTIHLEMNDFGTTKFAQLTANNVQKQLAILVNGKVIMAPTIQVKIPGGRIQITGSFSKKEIDNLFDTLVGSKK